MWITCINGTSLQLYYTIMLEECKQRNCFNISNWILIGKATLSCLTIVITMLWDGNVYHLLDEFIISYKDCNN